MRRKQVSTRKLIKANNYNKAKQKLRQRWFAYPFRFNSTPTVIECRCTHVIIIIFFTQNNEMPRRGTAIHQSTRTNVHFCFLDCVFAWIFEATLGMWVRRRGEWYHLNVRKSFRVCRDTKLQRRRSSDARAVWFDVGVCFAFAQKQNITHGFHSSGKPVYSRIPPSKQLALFWIRIHGHTCLHYWEWNWFLL